MAASVPLTAPPQAEAMQRFIETEDLSRLEKPLVFERADSRFKKMMCCQAAIVTGLTFCLNVPYAPIGACCPYTYTDEFKLGLDRDSVTFQAAANDCCCHIAKTLKTVPLDKIQDVELQSNCLLTCFGLKSVSVQTAGQSGSAMPEVCASFVKEPEKVREAIQLAVKLYRQQQQQTNAGGGYVPPTAAAGHFGYSNGAAAKQKGVSLVQRLQDLEALVTRGVLTCTEADDIKVVVLAAPDDFWLSRLSEAADLRDRALISTQEFEQLKDSLATQLRGLAAVVV